MNATFANLQKYFKFPFAATSNVGTDMVDISDTVTGDGTISMEKGFTNKYSIAETPVNYKKITRQVINKLFQWVTANLYIISRLGVLQWDTQVANDGGYDINATVWKDNIQYRNTVANNTADPITANSGWIPTHYNFTRSTTVASTATVNLNGDVVKITGTTNITGFTRSYDISLVHVIFTGALTLINSAELILPGGVNKATTAGDSCMFIYVDGSWKCINYYGVNGDDTIVEKDLTPKLGGDLDCNYKTITKSAIRGIATATPIAGATHTFDYAQGDYQKVICSEGGALTLAFSNMPDDKVSAFIFDLVNGGSCTTITHPTGMKFAYKTSPSYTVSGTDRLLVTKDTDNTLTLNVIAQDIGVPV